MTATTEASPTFDAARAVERLKARGSRLGNPLTFSATTGSTNDDALAAARAGAAHGALFVSDEQTSGRGRRGHAWRSEPGRDLTFSIVLRPELPLERVVALPLVAGLAVRAAAAQRVRAKLALKWPNDVVADGRKLAGILSESALSAGRVAAVVVGVGVNVGTRTFDDELASSATSLALLGAARLEREDLLADIVAELEPRLFAYESGGLAELLPELSRYDALSGRRVTVEGTRGTARGIDESGALIIESADRQLVLVIAGTVVTET